MPLEENEHIELKKSVSELGGALKSISAILNKHNKGTVYFNVANDGTPIENDVSEKTLRKISQAISDKIEPKIYPRITMEDYNSVKIVRVRFEGYQTPYSAEGRYYIRVADEDKQMSQEELKRFILAGKDLRWDAIENDEFTLGDISDDKVKRFCRLADIEYSNVEDILLNVNLIKNEKLLNAAVILFGKNPSEHFQNAKLMCSVFGTENTAVMIDQKEFEGDIFYLIETAVKYILQNIHIGMKVEGLYREDIPEINPEALREAVTNAFLHRDYFDPDFVSVFVFKDRVEIRNPGKLFGGITIEDILTKNISRRRNEVIADILSRAHYGERKGHGIALIKEVEPDAEFEQIGDLFISTFRRPTYINTQKLFEKLAEKQKKIILFILENPKISKRELANKLGVSTTAVDKHIEKLKEMNILKRIGPAKGGEWKVVNKK